MSKAIHVIGLHHFVLLHIDHNIGNDTGDATMSIL